jgi:hypothetical protein
VEPALPPCALGGDESGDQLLERLGELIAVLDPVLPRAFADASAVFEWRSTLAEIRSQRREPLA